MNEESSAKVQSWPKRKINKIQDRHSGLMLEMFRELWVKSILHREFSQDFLAKGAWMWNV